MNKLSATLLLAAAGGIVYGTWLVYVPAAWLVAGALLAVAAWMLLDDGQSA